MTETEPHARTRTLVASFLFTDLVGFSIGSAAEQTAAKATLSSIIRSDIAALRESDYRIRDTGDGALIAFVTDPEHALYMALAIAQDFGRAAAVAGFPSNSLRTGLHLGAVKEVIDVEARPNFIGDGINAAKRIMDFAAPGQITASRAFFDAVAGLDSAFAALFKHVGAPDDKHGRAHELYTVEPSDAVLERLKQELAAGARESAASRGKSAIPSKARLWPAPAITADGQASPDRAGQIARKWIFPVIGVAAIGIAVMVVAARLRDSQAPTTAGATPAAAKGTPPEGTSPASPTSAIAPSRSAESPTPVDSPPKSALQPKPETMTPPSGRVATDLPKSDAPKPATAPAVAVVKSNVAVRPRSDAAPSATVQPTAASERNSARCSRIMEKATLGEALSTEEKKELASSCR